jgi:hypothetical protein
MAKHPKGHYSKAARHARKMESCGKCQAQAARILEARPPRPRKPRAPRAKKVRNTRITFDADGNPMPPPPRRRRGPNKFTTSRRFVGPIAPGTVVIRKRRRAPTGTMTPDQISAAGRSMAARISAKMARARERRMMRANDSNQGYTKGPFS